MPGTIKQLVVTVEDLKRLLLEDGADLNRFVGFLRLYHGIDRLNSLHIAASSENSKGPGHTRDVWVLHAQIIVTLVELAQTSNQLGLQRDSRLRRMLASWNEPAAVEIRNQFGAHLGHNETYKRGLQALVDSNEELRFVEADNARDSFHSGWLQALGKGIEATNQDLARHIEESRKLMRELQELAAQEFRAFVDSVESAQT